MAVTWIHMMAHNPRTELLAERSINNGLRNVRNRPLDRVTVERGLVKFVRWVESEPFQAFFVFFMPGAGEDL